MPCECGHDYDEHVDLPGFPGGCQECQADDCDCGQYRASDTPSLRRQRRRGATP